MQKKAFTLIEILVAVAIIAMVLTLAVPSVVGLMAQNKEAYDEAAAKTLNQAAEIARFKEMVGPGTYGSDKEAALTWYLSENLIQKNKPVDISRLEYLYGYWFPYPFENSAEAIQSFYIQNPTQDQLWTHFAQKSGYNSVEDLAKDYGYSSVQQMKDGWWEPIETTLAGWAGVTDLTTILDRDRITNDPQALHQILASLDGLTAGQINDIFKTNTHVDENWDYITVFPLAPAQAAAAVEALKTYGNIPGNTAAVASTLSRFASQFLNPESTDYNPAGFDFENFPFDPGVNSYLSELSLAGTNITPQQLNQFKNLYRIDLANLDVSTLNFSNKGVTENDFSKTTGLTGSQVNSITNNYGNNYSGLNLAGLNPTGKNFGKVDFSNVTGIDPVILLNASSLNDSNLSGLDFSSTPLTQSQINKLVRTNLNNTRGITGTMLNSIPGGANTLTSMQLQGLDLSGLNTTGKNLYYADLRNTNITGAQLSATGNNWYGVKISPASLAGFDATGKALDQADFGPTITTPAQFVAATGITPGPGTYWINGTRPWG